MAQCVHGFHEDKGKVRRVSYPSKSILKNKTAMSDFFIKPAKKR